MKLKRFLYFTATLTRSEACVPKFLAVGPKIQGTAPVDTGWAQVRKK